VNAARDRDALRSVLLLASRTEDTIRRWCRGLRTFALARLNVSSYALDFIPIGIYIYPAWLDQGRRRSRRSKREQGAVPDNGIALERREAQGSSQGPARPGTPTTLKTWVPEAWRAGWLIAKPA